MRRVNNDCNVGCIIPHVHRSISHCTEILVIGVYSQSCQIYLTIYSLINSSPTAEKKRVFRLHQQTKANIFLPSVHFIQTAIKSDHCYCLNHNNGFIDTYNNIYISVCSSGSLPCIYFHRHFLCEVFF